MTARIVEEIQAVVDRLHAEGHTVATRLENALGRLKDHFKHDSEKVVAEVKTDVEHVAAEEKPIEAEVKADATAVVAEVKADAAATAVEVEKNLAEPGDVAAPAKK